MTNSTSHASHPLRILHVVPTYYPAVRYGGPIRSVHGLAAALVRRGHDVHVFTTSVDGDADLDVPLDQPVDMDGVIIHYFRVPALRRLFWAPTLGSRLREAIATFDIVHLHSVFLFPTRAAARAAVRAGVPYVVSPHGMLIRDVIQRRSRWAKTAWIRMVERTTLARAAAVHVTAELERAELRALDLQLPQIVAHVPNGIDIPAQTVPLSKAAVVGLPQRYALFLSRINWKKGLDRLIEAWQWVPELPLVIAGNDDEGYRPKLEALAQSLGVADRVLFVGPVSDEHKWAMYEQAQLFLLPSYSENFGIVVAEAMAMGCPVVVTPEVGIAQLVESAAAGVVASNDPPKLAAVIVALLADEARRRELGRRGREFARAHLSWTGIVEQMEHLYQRASDGRTLPAQAPELGRT
jgi:glycosyltransferase involved in cell wall biosynthesis